VLGNGSINAESYAFEPPEADYNNACADAERDRLRSLGPTSRREDEVVQEMRKHKYSEIQGGKIVVNISDTPHDEERNVVKCPSKKRYLADI